MRKITLLSLTPFLFGMAFADNALHSKNGVGCPPQKSFIECTKAVATEFQSCSDTVTLHGAIKNPEQIRNCAERARQQKGNCYTTCSKEDKENEKN